MQTLSPQWPIVRTALSVVGCAALLYVVLFWRLGAASFWDPDEARYAQATRELIETGDWWAPSYNGEPFFDKPILFYWLQAVPMSLAPQSEAAARAVPAVAGLLLVGVTAWLGAELFGFTVGITAGLLLATNAGVFALARYAILDLPFTLFLFSGVSAVTVALRHRRQRLEYVGYVLIGLATATKGPLALALCGLTFGLACAVSADARRHLFAAHWVKGMFIAVAIGLPWPLLMFGRFGRAFVEAYVLNENIRLFATPMYSGQPAWWFYLSVVVTGMLPWSGVFMARGLDVLRQARQERPDVSTVLLWSWVVAIVGFFSLSHFKLDHYVFPASPALCVICASAWHDYRADQAPSSAMRWGIRLVGPILLVAGAAMAYASLVLLDLPRAFLVVPLSLLVTGGFASRYGWSRHPLPEIPLAPIVAMAIVFAGALGWVIPKLEAGKVIPDVAGWVAAHATPQDRVAAFRLNRWNTAYRFYVNRQVTVIESDENAREFFSNPTPFYCVMTGALYDALKIAGVPLRVAYEREGRWVTSGRALWRRGGDRTRFVVAVPDRPPAVR